MKKNKITTGLLLLPLTIGVSAVWSPRSVAETAVTNDKSDEQVGNDDENVEFDSQFLYSTANSEKIDTRRFSKGNPVVPGVYSVGIFINGSLKLNSKVNFVDNGTNIASPCLTQKLLEQLDILIDIDKEDTADISPEGGKQRALI